MVRTAASCYDFGTGGSSRVVGVALACAVVETAAAVSTLWGSLDGGWVVSRLAAGLTVVWVSDWGWRGDEL